MPKSLEEVIASVHPEDREQLLQELNRALSETGTFIFQYRAIDSAKKTNWFESHGCNRSRRTRQSRQGLIGITQNITERKQMEEIRHTWAERLEAAREEERRRLSLQLHDDIVQQLAVASIKLQRLEKNSFNCCPKKMPYFPIW
ncbi:MAG: PAS domain-containing protein [Pyrinomonadaceae bacterium]